MATRHYDVIVLGLGGMGSAALHAAARRGLRVCGVEQYHVAHDRGSSHGALRMIRKAYYEHPDYVPLLERAYALWGALEEESGARLFARSGLVLFGGAESESIRGLETCYGRNDLPHERLTWGEALARFPQYRAPEGYVCYYDPEAGYLYVEECVEQHLAMAERHGAELRLNEPAIGWKADGRGVVVSTERGVLYGDRLIMTVGPWAGEVLDEIGVSLEVVRKVQLWYRSPDMERYSPPDFLPFFVETEDGVYYGFPNVGDAGLKVAEHSGGERVWNPQTVSRELTEADEARVLRFLGRTFPEFEAALARFSVCMYTKTPDSHFILDRHPGYENVVIGAGFSGHGFKFAPVVGEILTDLAETGATKLPAEFLRLNRLLEPAGRG